MAPTQVDVERQTSLIIHCLLEDEDDVSSRQLDVDLLEADGPGSSGELVFVVNSGLCPCERTSPATSLDDKFDPVVIADKLKHIADTMSEDAKFKAALTDLKQAVAQEALEAAFSRGVEVLCQTTVPQTAEVTPELQLIRASVAFGLYLKKSTPELKNKVQSVMTAFLNTRVSSWVAQQGGWDKLPGV